MMTNTLLSDTLRAMEQVEVTFEETLRTIDNINQRYKIVSTLKEKAAKRQQSYEAEIQAAITEPKFFKMPSLPKKPKKVKKGKKRSRKQKLNKSLTTSCEQTKCPFMCLQTNCIYEFDNANANIHQENPDSNYESRNLEEFHQTDDQFSCHSIHYCSCCCCKDYK